MAQPANRLFNQKCTMFQWPNCLQRGNPSQTPEVQKQTYRQGWQVNLSRNKNVRLRELRFRPTKRRSQAQTGSTVAEQKRYQSFDLVDQGGKVLTTTITVDTKIKQTCRDRSLYCVNYQQHWAKSNCDFLNRCWNSPEKFLDTSIVVRIAPYRDT